MLTSQLGEQRVPFDRPAQARPGYTPHSLTTGFISSLNPFPTVMFPMMASMPAGIRQPLAAEPGGAPSTIAPSGAAAASASATLPGRVTNAPRVMSPALVIALGIMPRFRGMRAVGPDALVATGRRPGL